MGRSRAAGRLRQGDPPWAHEAGVQAVVDAVRDLRFPASREDLAAQVGDREVQVAADLRLPLAAVLRKLKEDTFTSPGDFQTAVQRHWAGIRP